MWSQQLDPHLQRNKQVGFDPTDVLIEGPAGFCCSNWTCSHQLQDILLQREEELFQLQEENQKLREFLNSSFVKNLKLQAKVHVHHEPKFRESHEPSLRCPLLPLSSKKVSGDGRGDLTRQLKRNLAGTDEGPFRNSPWPPPQISKRVCRNITTEFSSESPPEPHLDGWVLRMLGLKDADAIDPSATSSCRNSLLKTSTSKIGLDSFFSSSSKDSCRTSMHHNSLENCCVSSNPCPDLIVSGPSRLYEDSKDMIRPSCPSNAFQSPPEEPDFRWPTAGPGGVLGSPSSSSSLVMNKQQRCVCSPGRPLGRCWTPADPPADVMFSMYLSPSSSIRTHSFPQGQAFIRNNPDGRWNFTWVPRHGP